MMTGYAQLLCKTDSLYVVILFLSVLIVLVLFNKWMDIPSPQVMINIFWMKDKSKDGKFSVTRMFISYEIQRMYIKNGNKTIFRQITDTQCCSV